MILIAVIAPSLVLIEIGAEGGLFSLRRFEMGGGPPAPLWRELILFFNLGGGCILAGLVPAVLILGIYRARPPRRDALQG